MGYLAIWKVLEEMVMDFKRRGTVIPANVMSDLRYAKTLINILRVDPSRTDTYQRVEECLRNVESYLISGGRRMFGDEYVEGWLKRLDEASRVLDEEGEERFIPGLPREQKWIRVKPSDELPAERLRALVNELGLSCNMCKGYMLIYGEGERIKEFIKKAKLK